jgi:hypothetical protein
MSDDTTYVRPPLTVRTPGELLAMEFDDSDVILDDRLLAESQSLVIAAQGGAGKSRLLIQFIAAQVCGRDFLNFKTYNAGLSWLVLQTENSNRRLQSDLTRIKRWLGEDYPAFNERVSFHTVENDSDGFVSLESVENQNAIADLITQTDPNIVVIDPLTDVAIGDLNKDVDMRATLMPLSQICRRGDPNRAIVVLHHAVTGKSGASKAVGYDRASFARNSKALLAWTRGQINIAPVDADSNDRLVVACGKNSNGKEFQPFAIKLNADMIYEVDTTVDIAEWQQDMTGSKDKTPSMTPDRLRELCATAGSTKKELAKAIMEDCGCYRGSAYRYITKATNKTIKQGKDDNYFRK